MIVCSVGIHHPNAIGPREADPLSVGRPCRKRTYLFVERQFLRCGAVQAGHPDIPRIVYTPAEALTASIMDKTIWKYNGNAYVSYDDFTPGKEGQLAAFDGFWVRTLQNAPADTTLLLPKVPAP